MPTTLKKGSKVFHKYWKKTQNSLKSFQILILQITKKRPIAIIYLF